MPSRLQKSHFQRLAARWKRSEYWGRRVGGYPSREGGAEMPAQKESTQAIRLRGLMSLASAARMVYARATGRHTDDVATLNNVARLIAAHTRIFELSIDKTAMSVSTETLAAGQLENGGESLQLKNRA